MGHVPPESPTALSPENVNGATLENSVSNIFPYADLTGLKWRCYMTPSSAPRGVHLSQDDVLKAYSKCIQEGIVCTWRRRPPGNLSAAMPEQLQIPSFTNDICKELWIFWYEQEPNINEKYEKLKNICEKLEQVQIDDFDPSCSPPITYEVRTLYFKAIHGALERTLMKNGHSRFGRWFCQPFRSHVRGSSLSGSSQYLRASRFHFFIHGGHSVCLAVITETKQTLIRLGKRHLETRKRVKVLTAPWSWKGELIPAHEAGDPAKIQNIQNQQYEEFKEFFPIEPEVETDDDLDSDDSTESESDSSSDSASDELPPFFFNPPKKDKEKEKEAKEPVAGIPPAKLKPGEKKKEELKEEKKVVEREEEEEEKEKPKRQKEHPFLEDGMPKMVVVEIAGVRFHYPTYLVYLTLEYDVECMNDGKDRNTHPAHIYDEHKVDNTRRRNPVCLEETTSNSVIQGVFQAALLPKKIPTVPATPSGDFATPYVAQADDETKWNFIDPGRSEKCLDEPSHSETTPLDIEDVDTLQEDRCAAYHLRYGRDRENYRGRREKDLPKIPRPLFIQPEDWDTAEEEEFEGVSDLFDQSFFPPWIHCNREDKAEITVDHAATGCSYNIAVNSPLSDDEAQPEIVCSPFTPIKCISPCNTCEWPTTVGQEMSEEIFSQIFKQGTSSVPPTASQEERANAYESYYNPMMRDNPDFKPYHNRRVGEKRRASYLPPFPMVNSPEQPGSQETIPAVSSVEESEDSPKGPNPLEMTRSSTVPSKMEMSDDELVPRKKGLKKKIVEGESEEEEFGAGWDDEQDNGYFTAIDRVGIACGDYEEVDDEIPCTIEKEEEPRILGEPIYSAVGHDGEPMDVVDHAVDSILSPPASNEQYQPLSLKATGPPSVPDANQIFPTPPSVLESQQFSPAGISSTVLSSLLHAPAIPSQLISIEHSGVEEQHHQQQQQLHQPTTTATVKQEHPKAIEEPMEIEPASQLLTPEKQKELHFKLQDKHPDSTKINEIIQKIADPLSVVKTPASETRNVVAYRNRFTSEEENSSSTDLLPTDFKKLWDVLSNLPQKPQITVPRGAPRHVGTSSNRFNMMPLDHENRSQQEHQKAYNVTFTPAQTPMMSQHPLAFPYNRNGMPMRPGMPPMAPPGYGGHHPGYGGLGMPPYGHPMNQGHMGVPPAYSHMPSPMYNQINPLSGMGNMAGIPMSPLHGGPMGHMGPGMGMSQAMGGGMHAGMTVHQFQQMQQRQQYMMQMSQMNQMGGGQPPHPGAGMNPWDPHGAMGMSSAYQQHLHQNQLASSPIGALPPHLHGMSPHFGGGPAGHAGNPIFQTMNSNTMGMTAGVPPSLPPMEPISREKTQLSIYMQPIGKLQHQPRRMRNLPLSNKNIYDSGSKPGTSAAEIKYPSVPEASSLVLTIILQDTIMDLHYDTSFDACPICSCNATIRTRELGLYLSPPEIVRKPPVSQLSIPSCSGFFWNQQNQNSCNCGFSAVRHRYLSMYNGLFPEDAQEATGVTRDEAVTPALGPWAGYDPKSIAIPKYIMDSTVNPDRAVLNQMRIMCQKGYVGKEIFMLAASQEALVRSLAPEDDCRGVPGSNAPYIVNYVDQTELLLLGNSAIDAALSPQRGPDRQNVSHSTFFHPWGIQIANELKSNDDEETLWMSSITADLLPILQESLKIVRPTVENTTVEGPLTWKDLTKMRQNSGKPKEEDCQPEPIPQIVVATDRELIRASPMILNQWELHKLAPIDQPKDILYLAVIPDNAEVHSATLKYMEALGAQYEKLRLGKHVALCYDDVREGIVRAGGRGRVGSKYQNKMFSFLELVDKEVQDKLLIARLRLFTQQMEDAVVGMLTKKDNLCLFNREQFRCQVAQESRAKKQMYMSAAAAAEKNMEAAMNPVQKEESGPGPATERRPSCLEELLNADTSMPPANPPALTNSVDPPLEPEDIPQEDYIAMPHVIVIYVINPFNYDQDSRTAVNARIAFAALVRAFNAICARVDPNIRTQLMLEIVGLEEINAFINAGPDFVHDGKGFQILKQSAEWAAMTYLFGRESSSFLDSYSPSDEMYRRCFDIFRAPRVVTPEAVRAVQTRFMTKCGPGFNLFETINAWEKRNPPMLYSVPSCAYHLAAPPRLLYDQANDKMIQLPPNEMVLYISYCIVGGDYLVGTVTDELGKITESVIINMKPNLKGTVVSINNVQFKAKTQIQDAMLRFMAFIHGVVTQDLLCVRLVIGRLGKMGHGEFKAWTSLLSKANLRKLSQKPKEGCKACHDSDGVCGTPKIVSACAISFEAEPYLKIFSSVLKGDYEKDRRKNLPKTFMTPGDIGVTHIMTFTVNTTIDLNSGEQMGNNHEDDNMDDFTMDFGGEDLGLGNEFDSIMDDVASGVSGMEGPGNIRNFRSGTMDLTAFDHTVESIQNQPLATGFYISTSPAPDLPDWFWSSCPLRKKSTPLHFKASLHINTQNIGDGDDEDLTSVTAKPVKNVDGIEISHPLDSNKNDAVLRHVLETYNALSWLNMDRVERDRVSCLPIHVQHLLRLYHAVTRIYL